MKQFERWYAVRILWKTWHSISPFWLDSKRTHIKKGTKIPTQSKCNVCIGNNIPWGCCRKSYWSPRTAIWWRSPRTTIWWGSSRTTIWWGSPGTTIWWGDFHTICWILLVRCDQKCHQIQSFSSFFPPTCLLTLNNLHLSIDHHYNWFHHVVHYSI